MFTEFKSSQSSDFIKRFAKKLELSEDDINKALDISDNIRKLDLASTHEPPSVAAGCLLLVINDRSQAIKTACALANSGDIVLLAGKGHEKYQDINGKKYPFDDVKKLVEFLNIDTENVI